MERTRAAVTDVYEDMRPLVNQIASCHAHRHGCDVDEAVADANLIFLNVLRTYDRNRGKLETRLQSLIRHRLHDIHRHEHGRTNRPATVSWDSVAAPATTSVVWDRDGFLLGLGADARVLVMLVLDTPTVLADAMRAAPGTLSLRHNLREYLTNTLGWAIERVRCAFNEIRLVLAQSKMEE